MKYLKEFVIVILCIVAGFYLLLSLFMGAGSLNFVKINQIKKSAQEYVAAQYPDYVVKQFKVKHDWYPNVYYVTYTDGETSRSLTYSSDKNFRSDNYINNIISDFSLNYRMRKSEYLKEKLLNAEYNISFVNINFEISEKEFYEKYKDTEEINEPLNCSVGFYAETTYTKYKFAEDIIGAKKVVDNENYNISQLTFGCAYDSEKPAYGSKWENGMGDMDAEQLSQFINN